MHSIDNLDQQILRVLTKDARTPYAEMAKNFGVSPGTIHVRVAMTFAVSLALF